MRRLRLAYQLLCALACLSILALSLQNTSAFANSFADTLDQAATRAQARVVKIYGAKVGRMPGYATGLLIGSEGQILTANGAHLNGEQIRVVLPDGSSHLATPQRRSRTQQLATLKIAAKTPKHFDLSRRSSIHKGQWVLAVSNLFKIADGVEPMSVMLGIVSLETKLEAKRGNRPFPYEGDVLLLDCIISNPGAPGGAVVDAYTGDLLGMVGPNLESRSSGTRLNYAIPVDVLNDFVSRPDNTPEARQQRVPARPYLGIRLFRVGGNRAPAYIDRIAKGSPAAETDLKPDDVILSIGDERVKTIQQYDEVVAGLVPGQPVEFTIKRGKKLIRIMLAPVAKQ